MAVNRNNYRNTKEWRIVLALTMARIPLALLFAAIFLSFEPSIERTINGIIILLIIEMTDLFDGILARRWGVADEWGAMLDPYTDSISRLIVFATLTKTNLALLLVPLSMAIRDITVAYSRIKIAQMNRSVAAKWSGKVKAIVQGVGGILLVGSYIYIPLVGDWPKPVISWIVIIVTSLSAIQYVKSALKPAD